MLQRVTLATVCLTAASFVPEVFKNTGSLAPPAASPRASQRPLIEGKTFLKKIYIFMVLFSLFYVLRLNYLTCTSKYCSKSTVTVWLLQGKRL